MTLKSRISNSVNTYVCALNARLIFISPKKLLQMLQLKGFFPLKALSQMLQLKDFFPLKALSQMLQLKGCFLLKALTQAFLYSMS